MKHIILFESFKSDRKWPLLSVHHYYDYSGPIKGKDIIRDGFENLVKNNAFLSAWFDDYGKAFDDEIGYDIFDDDFFWGHTDENIYPIMSDLKREGIDDILFMDLYAITFAEICNNILNEDPSFKRDFDAEDEVSAISQGVEDLSSFIDSPKIISGIKKARKKAIDELVSKGHMDWEGKDIYDIEELKSHQDFPPYKNYMPMQSGIQIARKRSGLIPWD
jgi:hypothetical protein